MPTTEAAPMQSPLLLSALKLLRVLALALIPPATAFGQPVHVMPVVVSGSPTGGLPRGWGLVNQTLFFDLPAPGGSGVPALWKSDGTAAGTVVVKDVNTDLLTAGRFTASSGKFFFPGGTAGSLHFPQGLWISDGTLSGTHLLRPGGVNEIRDVNGTAFFVDASMLLKSDGTNVGTVLVKEHPSLNVSGLVNFGGTLLYAVNGPSAGLWRSDGTAAGTVLVKAFSSLVTTQSGVHNGKLYFVAAEGAGARLWASDGTPSGTVPISSEAGPAVSPVVTSVGPYVYFVASDAATGREPWRSDGTLAGTVMLADIEPGPGDSNPVDFSGIGNAVLFSASTTALGRELWKTDGTAPGTALFKEFFPGTADSRPTEFVMANGALCFVIGTGGTTNSRQLWRTDGTVAGTIQLMPDVEHTFIDPVLVSTGTRVYVKRRTSMSSFQLWSSDCTSTAGNVLVKDFPSSISNASYLFNSLTAMSDHVMLRATTTAHGQELWRGDTTGTLVKDVEPGPASGLETIGETSGFPIPEPPKLGTSLRVGNTLYFRGVTSTHGAELWRSDGTAAGTFLVKDIAPGTAHSYPWGFTEVNGTLFFVANDGPNGYELWKSDGTEAGTVLVKDIRSGPNSSFNIYSASLMNVNGMLYFRADDGVAGDELWKSDGTAAGTVLVSDIVPGLDSSTPTMLADLGGALLFAAFTPGLGYELWRSDGTAAGTVLVKDIRPGTAAGAGSLAVVMNGVAYFPGFDGTGGAQLWRSDGTAAGTTRVFNSSSPQLVRLTAVGNTLYFWTTGLVSTGLWKSDGTVAGTVLVRSFADQSMLLSPDAFVGLNGIVYFVALEGWQGLWRTDGTTAGTYVVDLFPNWRGANPVELTVVGDRLYFVANDGVNPRSLYYYVPRSPAAEVTRLGNLSSRLQVGTGDNVMIGGFVIGGQAAKRVAIVATGPSLSAFGIANPMQNPTLRLVRSSDQATILTNDDWQTAANAAQLQAAGFAPPDSREAAIMADLAPGAYTAIVEGANGGTGVAVVGIYEVDQPGIPLVNLAARGPVSSGENVMIAGFIIQGPNPQTVAVVATGPSLAAYGIANPLANPALAIVRASDQSVVATNDNWMDAANAAQLEGKGFAPLQANEAGILVTLPPGAYTAIVSGAAGSAGIGVVGVYRVN
jgi:ELWxxDGT repeat protein